MRCVSQRSIVPDVPTTRLKPAPSQAYDGGTRHALDVILQLQAPLAHRLLAEQIAQALDAELDAHQQEVPRVADDQLDGATTDVDLRILSLPNSSA
ncbi:MAG: hypothetical protein R3B07_31060 [Polyangiaceae bacterium]